MGSKGLFAKFLKLKDKDPLPKPWVYLADAIGATKFSSGPGVGFRVQLLGPTPRMSPTPTPTAKSVSGIFTGPVVDVSYGNVQVQITVSNGKITDAQALIAPTGKNDRYTSFSVPVLRKQTLAAQSDAIQGASGASYTSYGWYKSLQGALSKAGL